jgi:phosphomannomutase
VTRAIDHLHGADGLPPADLLAFELADGSRALVRPSGTEPKVKCYFEVVVPRSEPTRAVQRLDALRTAFREVAGTMRE